MPSAAIKKRASRLSRDPVLDRDREPKFISPGKLTADDLQWLLATYEHLTSATFLAALTDRKVEPTRRRLKLLKRCLPRPYIDIWEEQRIHPKAYQNAPQFFEITEAGVAALEEHGFVLPPRFPASHPRHHIMSDQGVLSFKIGLKHHPEIEYIGPAAIHKSKHTPPKTRDSKTWYRFPYAARGKSQTACPDYFPIGFRRIDALGIRITSQDNPGQLRAKCPRCTSSNNRALSMNTERNLFTCFANKPNARGDVIALTAHVRGTGQKEAAEWLLEHFPAAGGKAHSAERNSSKGGAGKPHRYAAKRLTPQLIQISQVKPINDNVVELVPKQLEKMRAAQPEKYTIFDWWDDIDETEQLE
jgi:hypothetical protein